MENRYVIQYDFKKKCITNVKFVQGDINSSVLEVQLYDNSNVIDITGETIEFRFLKCDGTAVFQDSTTGVTIKDATNGIITCTLMANSISCVGNVVCQIMRKKNGNTLSTPSFNFTVERSIENAVISGNYIASIESKLLEYETNENDRKENEDTRNNNETNRTNTFNALQSTMNTLQNTLNTTNSAIQSNENDRITNENNRVARDTARETQYTQINAQWENVKTNTQTISGKDTEIISARTNPQGTTFATLGARLDKLDDNTLTTSTVENALNKLTNVEDGSLSYDIGGKTLQNLIQLPINTPTTLSGNLTRTTLIKTNTVYTVIFYGTGTSTITTVNVTLGGATTNITGLTTTSTQKIIKITTPSTLIDNNIIFSTDGVIINNTMLLEGDWTSKEIPPYFSSLQSAGQDLLPYHIFPLKHSAGRFNFSLAGVTNVKWVYPDGSVSTALAQDRTVADGATMLFIYDNDISALQIDDTSTDSVYTGDLSDFQGKLTNYLSLYNCTNITGSLADLQGKLTNYLSLYGCNNITGSLADLQGKLTNTLNLANCTNITGSLADLQGKLTNTLSLNSCTNITGSLADLQGKLTNTLSLNSCTKIIGSLLDLQGKITNILTLHGCTNITGSLADLQGKVTNLLNLTNCNKITGIYSPISTATGLKSVYLYGTAQTTAEVDQTIINIANVTTATGGTLETNARTSASDSAVATLKAKSWTVKCNNVVQ